MRARRQGVCLMATGALLALAPVARAQGSSTGCDREGTTSFEFGHTSAELEPTAFELLPDGRLRKVDDERQGAVLGRVPRDSVLALSRRAWRAGFGALPPAPRRSGRKAKLPRPYIELHSACGSHHVEYIPGEESRLFRELYARLTRFATLARRRR